MCSFELYSLKPIQGNDIVNLTVFAPCMYVYMKKLKAATKNCKDDEN